jgi:hypothetical protein
MRQDAVAMSPVEAEGWAKIGGTVLAVAGAFAAGALKVARWWRRAREKRRLESKAIRYLLDATRHGLHVLQPGRPDRDRFVDLSELARQLALVSDVREELWVADGNASRREGERLEREIVKVLTRTQAIQARQQQQNNLFSDGWNEDFEK